MDILSSRGRQSRCDTGLEDELVEGSGKSVVVMSETFLMGRGISSMDSSLCSLRPSRRIFKFHRCEEIVF